MSQLIPLARLVLVEPIATPTMDGGLHLPASKPVYSDTARGKVVEMGYDINSVHFTLGDTVHYRRGEACTIKHGGKDLVVVPARDVLVKEVEES